jgi:cytochrome b6-f complex iron-sulfur subunit
MEKKGVDTERRRFLGWISAAAAAVLAAFASLVGVGFLYPIKRRKPRPLFVCLKSEVPKNQPLEIKDTRGRKVLLMLKTGGELMAIGTVCSHLGCTVFYRPKKKIFECPCHSGVFDQEGNPVSGPPQEPLHRYPVMVKQGKVFIQFA